MNIKNLNINYKWIVTGVIFLIGFLHTYWYKQYQPDDAFIYLVYVQSFLDGKGLTFNGELVEGYSSILWTLLVAGFSSFGGEPLFVAKCIGWVSYILTAVVMMLILNRIENKNTLSSFY
jgi:hypothetical protein